MKRIKKEKKKSDGGVCVHLCVQENNIPSTHLSFFFPFIPSAFSNRKKLTWDFKAQDGSHDAIFYNDNLGKKANITSNHLLALNKKHRNKDFTEKRLHLTWSNILSQFSLNYL